MSLTTTRVSSNSSTPTRTISNEALAYRLQLGIAVALAAGAALALVMYLVLALNWRSQPFLGVMLTNTVTVNRGQPTTMEPWTGLAEGLRAGDTLISINGTAIATGNYPVARMELNRIRETLRPGDVITVEFVRPPDSAIFKATYTLTRLPDSDFFIFFIVPFVSGILIYAIGLGVLYFRRDKHGGVVAATTAFFVAIFTAGLFDLGTTFTLARFWLLAGTLGGGSLVMLGLVFPNPLPFTYRWVWAQFVPLLVGLALGILLILRYDQGAPTQSPQGSNISVLSLLFGSIILMGIAAYQRRRAITQMARDQASMILVGMALSLAPGVIWVLDITLQPDSSLIALEAMMPFLITPIIGMAVAIFQTSRLDSDWMFSRAVTYTVLMGALAIGYFLLTLGAGLIASESLASDHPLLIAVTLFVVAILFIPVRTYLQGRIDQVYFRRRRNYQERLEAFGREISGVSSNTPTIRAFRRVLEDAIAPASAFVFLPSPRSSGEFVAFGESQPDTDVVFAADSGVVEYLNKHIRNSTDAIYLQPGKSLPPELVIDRARLSILKTHIMAPLVTDNDLLGIVSIGPARSGIPYTYEEMRFLNGMINQLSVAVERAQVINSLERRVRELDVLSQVGQAVNFTIEFDDLLELISTRTSRLIDSAHFYITLFEKATNQLYFAFFLENDERYPDYEGNRWTLGNDLFSEIVRTGQPMRVDDYSKTTTEGGFATIYDNDYVKAWMGVPLIAGSNILGAMAVGKAKSGEPYTVDQLRIFSSIGALAATSIEKARLFGEVNVRARQLTVLNEISQQLVQAEAGEVEALLKIITTSAVQILNAAAGSLLLEADDDNTNMVFRVAIGGTGEELVGKRIKSNHGLVGEVVRTKQHAIVNDTNRDERWKGEVSNTFRTNSILAVPLSAKDRVIGVLEVLNKKDGTPFVGEDAELLTTFAGQAAIAIENARLFQMTGSQLNKRLEELETLERIDFELNRTLDLQHVAEITVKWAVASSSAVAGALGMVVEANPPFLRIMAKYGYRDDEVPEGAEGNRWPLDKGIVRRVIRTLQADLADTKIDPDYTPSLKGAISQITVPMVTGGELNAILILETNKEPRFNLIDLSFVQRLAEHASIAVANAQLLDQLQFAAESKSEFVGFAAHELKNPLTSIKGYAAVLNGEMASAMPPEMRANAIGVILNNAERMQSIIDDMRDIARSDAGKFELELKPTALHRIAEDSLLPFAKQIADKDQTAVNNVKEDLPLIMGDRNKLIQVLVNLISNAYKYSPEGATITLDAKVENNFRNNKNQLMGTVMHIMVQDTGIGMSPEDLKRLFKEDYFRSSDERAQQQKGTGLGMIITQRIVEGHGGQIWVESTLNVGTTFHIVVPVAPTTGDVMHKAPTQINVRKTDPHLPAIKPESREPASD